MSSVSDNTDVIVEGILHIYVGFDWGELIDVDEALKRIPAEVQSLPRRRRTPSSFAYRPPPLRVPLGPTSVDIPELGHTEVQPEATIFDFAAVSVAIRIPFRLEAAALTRLAAWLAEPDRLVKKARTILQPLYESLIPAIQEPLWLDDLNEEYFVFQLPPGEPLLPHQLLEDRADWTAGVLRLEEKELSKDEIRDALERHLCYSPDDLFVPDWASAVLLDRDCEETLQTIEFTNLQLLEFRLIDNRLDDNMRAANRIIRGLTGRWFPFWRTHSKQLHALGQLKVEANGLFERTGNVLKLVGDQYLARVHRHLAERFHLQDWEKSIQRKISLIESIYRVLSDQAATYRTELLEATIVLLIVVEIVMTLLKW